MLAVVVGRALVVGGLVLSSAYLKTRPARGAADLLVVAGGAFCALMFLPLRRIVVASV